MRENNEPEKLRIQAHFREWKSAESFDSSHKKLIIWLTQNNFLSIVTPKRSFYFKVYLVVSLILWNRFFSWEKRKKESSLEWGEMLAGETFTIIL